MSRWRIPRWLKIVGIVLAMLLVAILAFLIGVGWYVKNQMLDSGGKLPASMAAYDVRHFNLAVQVFPDEQRIQGSNTITIETVSELGRFEINLDNHLEVESVTVDGAVSPYRHSDGVIVVELPAHWAAGDRHEVTIDYGGKPKVALRPPWINGFVWSETPMGEPWIGVTGQIDGGDNWWPCKDHPSDEPDEGMNIALTVPAGLVGLSNGRFLGETDNGDGTVTTRWKVGYPINDYLVTVNIAPYVPIEERYQGIDGDLDVPLVFWSVPEYEPHARRTWRQMPRILEVLGRRFGEYPFFDDKFAVAHAPYYGMEHQTLVAYGALFTDNNFNFDDLLLHEVAHEWWGNKISVSDWADFWIQEGFATYAEALFVLDTLGEERYLDYMRRLSQKVRNRQPVIRGEDLTSAQAYSGDIYFKGACVLHTLRWLIGDDDFFEVIWRFADGDNPGACRLVATEDLAALVAEISGKEIDWFWERYLYRAEQPGWRMVRRERNGSDRVQIFWDDPEFELPLPILVGGEELRVEMTGGRAELLVDRGVTVEIDPQGRVYADEID
jgi:aminopeptidase N